MTAKLILGIMDEAHEGEVHVIAEWEFVPRNADDAAKVRALHAVTSLMVDQDPSVA